MLKIIKSYASKDCIGCVLSGALWLAQIVGSLANISCPHRDKTSKSSKFKISQVYVLMNVFVICSILTTLLMFVVSIFKMDYRGKLFVKSMTEIFIYSGTGIVLIYVNLRADLRIMELNGLSSIIDQKHQYGIEEFLCADDVSKIFYIYCAWLSLFTIGQIANITSYLSIELNWSVLFIATVREVCFYSQMTFIFNAAVLCHVYLALFNRCFFKIKDVLGKNLRNDFAHSVTQYITDLRSLQVDDAELLQSMQKMRKLYRNLFLNYQLTLRCMSPQFVYWWIIGILLLITGIYFLVTVIIEEASLTYYEFIFYMKVISAIFGVSWYVRIFQGVTDVNEDIMSFLFRYPISKLNQAEAAQVEMMITTLHIQKPVLKTSDILTVGTELLASISGTIVTYVLMALQFHASWNK